MLGFSPSYNLSFAKHSSCCVLIVFLFVRIFLLKVSYTLSISSLVLMTGLIIILVYVIVLFCVPKRTPEYDEVAWVSYHLF